MPRNSREDSEHQEQHRNRGLRAVRIAEGFPNEYLRSATNVMVIKIRKSQARCDFEDIPPGSYAMAVIDDEDMNDKLDTNWLGVPTEGYGFSNDATGVLGPPLFAAASFKYDRQNVDLTMSLDY
jgi:uncharacterized protein (DUF2141 family)